MGAVTGSNREKIFKRVQRKPNFEEPRVTNYFCAIISAAYHFCS
jgi:hypothetical protein